MKLAIQTSNLPDGRSFDPKTTALVEEADGHHGQTQDSSAGAVLARAENTVVEVRVHSREPSLLVLSDLFYPGWTAFVNGAPARILRTNYVQRGVWLPKGDNTVRFQYRPKSFYIGLRIALAGIFGIYFTILHRGVDSPASFSSTNF